MSKRVFLIHGFNVWDRGAGTIDILAPGLVLQGYRVLSEIADYGWTWLFSLRRRNELMVTRLLEIIEPGDTLIAHSNGCLLAWMLVEAGAPVSKVVCIQPALRKDTRWRDDVKVLCIYNDKDYVVRYGGRWWGRFASIVRPWKGRHGWGAAGYFGFTESQPNVESWNTNVPPVPITGHSEIFKMPQLAYWESRLWKWLTDD